jgi:hypothetical protein
VDRRAATGEELLLYHTPEYPRTAKLDALPGRPSLTTGGADITPNSWDIATQPADGGSDRGGAALRGEWRTGGLQASSGLLACGGQRHIGDLQVHG